MDPITREPNEAHAANPMAEEFISKNRLEALVDGVFAFAMTLLVLSLAIPPIQKSDAAKELPVYISGMFPEFVSFLIAFLLLATFWVVHHRHFHFLKAVDPMVLWINILLLIFIVFVPFSTSVSGDYSFVTIADDLFHVNLLAIGLVFLVHWAYISHAPHLLKVECPESVVRCGTIRGLVTYSAHRIDCTGLREFRPFTFDDCLPIHPGNHDPDPQVLVQVIIKWSR